MKLLAQVNRVEPLVVAIATFSGGVAFCATVVVAAAVQPLAVFVTVNV
jgi:hypothetical protein